ncbi:MAG: right-handed parallel beta-helix repeat-containing protein, partial [Deltaproteobacteria bacterium]|nr:right-handed parallel beta-helix repeat-containing protein [Deltaproteobacteria bacterium]
GNVIRGINIDGGSTVGLIFEASHTINNIVEDVVVANRDASSGLANAGVGVLYNGGPNNILRNLRTFNNEGFGLVVNSTGLSLQNAFIANNGAGGVSISAGVTIAGATVVNNGVSGIVVNVTAAQPVILHDLVVANHLMMGLDVSNAAGSITLSQVAAFANTAGLHFGGPSTVKVVGQLLFGGNLWECDLPTAPTDGIAQGAGGSKPCDLLAPSTGTVHHGVTGFGSSFLGRVGTNDLTNASDASGIAAFAALTDWLGFDHPERTWGLAGASAFPSADQRGRCASGNCQIWDFALAASDTVLRNTSFDGSAQNAAGSGGTCPAAVAGSTAVTSYDGSITFLPSAIESGASGGNLNGLCEANEDCLYAPNFGAYQGSGGAAPCAYSAAGGPAGIAISVYPTNGR